MHRDHRLLSISRELVIMPSPGMSYQMVVLAGGDDKRLYPLGGVKALLPVANKPLLSYPLRTISEAGLKHAFVVRLPDLACS